jgi:CheY-like chemotaxis protein
VTLPAPVPRPLILVVEDDQDIRNALLEILPESGFEVVSAENGAHALRVARAVRPSVILLDLMMPVMTGWEFREEQLKDPALSDIPVIVLSASGIRAIEGALLLEKPIALERLLASIRTVLSAR